MKNTRRVLYGLTAYCVLAIIWYAWAQLFDLTTTTQDARSNFLGIHSALAFCLGFALFITAEAGPFGEHK